MKHVSIPRVRGIAAVRAQDDLAGLIAQVNTAFEAFKAEQAQAIADLKKGQEDVVRTEKIGRIETSITDLTTAVEDAKAAIDAMKIGGGAGDAPSAEAREYAKAFDAYARRGKREDDLPELAVKAALTTDSDPDGGYFVPENVDSTVTRVLGLNSAVRSVARVVSVGSDSFKMLVGQGGAESGWVAERGARPETETPRLAQLDLAFGELYANPAASQRTLDDAMFNVESWLADEIAIAFAEAEGAAYIKGDGNKKPRGLLSYDLVANASYAWGKIGYIASGKADGFLAPTASASPADALVDLFYALKAGYRNGASFLMGDATVGTIRKFKDGDGTWLWQPPTAEGPATILGKPVITDDHMPGVAAGEFPVLFGDFARAYTIADVVGTRVLRDPFTNKPFVHFYTTKRVGGGVSNYEAVKALKIATS